MIIFNTDRRPVVGEPRNKIGKFLGVTTLEEVFVRMGLYGRNTRRRRIG